LRGEEPKRKGRKREGAKGSSEENPTLDATSRKGPVSSVGVEGEKGESEKEPREGAKKIPHSTQPGGRILCPVSE